MAILGDGDSGGSESGLAAIITELSDGDEVGGTKVWKDVGKAGCWGEARDFELAAMGGGHVALVGNIDK